MHNLEGISFEEVVDEKGLSYVEYRKTLRTDYTATWLHIGGGLIAVIACCLASWYFQQSYPSFFWLTIPLFSIVLGIRNRFYQLIHS